MKRKLIIGLISVMILVMLIPNSTASSSGHGRKRNVVTIVRDNYGVPHVFAKTKEGLAFGAGYAMAQDRLWQADMYRRSSFGNLAELGLASIQSDYETRSLGYSREELREIFDNWEPSFPEKKLKEMMLAYVDGINLYIAEALEAYSNGDTSLMPIEYLPEIITPDGLPLELFTIEDCTVIVVMMAWRFGATGGGELNFAARYMALESIHGDEDGWEIFNDIYPQVDPGAPTTIPDSGCNYPSYLTKGSKPDLPANIGDVFQMYEEVRMGQTELLESLGMPTKFGSNAWMVTPEKSSSRSAMQVGGPQMGHSTPQIVLEIGLHGAGINAVGMMMPHAPTILIGVSDYGAWTSTTGSSDLVDTYIEVLNPDNPYQYLFNGKWVDMEKRTERIYGYKKLWYEERDIYRTIHGPIIGWDLDNHLCYSMKVPFFKNELAAEEGWSLFQQSKNLYDAQEASKRVELSHNFLWADKKGNIAYWHMGYYPIKPELGLNGRKIDDRFPLWGTGKEEWVGLTTFKDTPKCVNPTQGFLANWNNKPIADWPYREADWGEVHGVSWIQHQLATGGKISFNDMKDINRNTGYNHGNGMYFLDFLINAAKDDSSIPNEVIEALEAWDHHYNDELDPKYPNSYATYDDPGLTIFDAWFQMIDNEVFDDDLAPGVRASSSTLLHVFDGEQSKLTLSRDYLNGEDKDTVIVRVLKEALVELEAYYGTDDISTWLTPVRLIFLNSLGALPTAVMHAMNRGTYNHVAEMSKRRGYKGFRNPSPHVVNVIPPGQSGFIHFVDGEIQVSPHAYDQLKLYDTWSYKPVLFNYRDIKNVAESWTILRI